MAGDKDIKYTVTAEDRFSRTFQTLRRELGSAASGADGLRDNLAGANVSFGALAAGPVTALTIAAGAAGLALRNLANDLDAFNDTADATGDSVENISGLEDIALRNGAGLDLVTTSLVKLNQALASAKKDSPAAEALKAIGLSAAELRDMAPSDALAAIARALQGYENDANKARIVQELFGKSLREIAPFLNDLAEAGTRVATVTSEQAKEAERFNKQLSALSANATQAARSLVGDLLPAVNRMFDEVRSKGVTGSLLSALGFDDKFMQTRAQAALGSKVRDLARERDGLQEMLRGDPYNADTPQRKTRLEQIVNVELPREIAAYRQAEREFLKIGESRAGAGRGFVNPEVVRPRVDDITDKDKPKADKVSEAQRYLESLQRQGLQVQQLTEYERVLAELQSGRIDGMTPKLREQILAQAKANDVAKASVEALNARVAAQTAAGKADDQRLAALDAENKALEKEVQAIGLTPAALADVELARIRETIAVKESTIAKREAAGASEQQLQVLNAEIDALKRRSTLLVDKVGAEAREEQRKANEQTGADARDTLSESIAEGILEGTRAGQSVMDTFWRELKAQAAKQVLQPIISPLVQAGNKLVEQLFGNIASAIFGGMSIDAGGVGITSGGTGLVDLGLGGGRANGGGVDAGHRYRVNENGTEEFIPATDGVILNARQTAARQQAGTTVNYAPNVVVNGDVSPQTIQLVQALLARNNQQLMRSMRTGGAFAN